MADSKAGKIQDPEKDTGAEVTGKMSRGPAAERRGEGDKTGYLLLLLLQEVPAQVLGRGKPPLQQQVWCFLAPERRKQQEISGYLLTQFSYSRLGPGHRFFL